VANMFERTRGFKIFYWTSLILIGLYVFFPLYWIIITSLKPYTEVLKVSLFPTSISFENYIKVFEDGDILRYMKNSLVVSITSCILTTIVCVYGGYSFSKFRYRGRQSFMLLIMSSKMLPYAVLLLSIYLMMKNYNLLDSYVSLILAYITFSLPVGMWTMKAVFDRIPDEIMESARMDGAGRMKTINHIMLPLAVPGMISTAIYGFVLSWNDLLYSLTLISSSDKRTLAPGMIMEYVNEFQDNWGPMMASSVIVSLPVTIMFILLQRFFIQGLTAGAVKG
jgi:multiple sugar transport system permease protein